MDTSARIATASAAVAVIAVGIAILQARSASVQARAARDQVAVARQQTELQGLMHSSSLQPYVYADFRLDPVSKVLLDVIVKNTGPTVATDVVVEFDPPLESTLSAQRGQDLPGMPATLSSLPPGRHMAWTLDSAIALFEPVNSTRPRSYRVKITGTGPFGAMDPLEYVLNINDYENTAARNTGTLAEVIKNLKAMAASEKTIAAEMSQIRHKLSNSAD